MADLPRRPGGVPTSPFEIEATKEILARRIEAGDIQQSDLDLLKKGYKWMTTASFLGSIGMALPTYYFFRRKQPPASLGVKLLAAGGMGMLGSFLGFTVGGAAAAAEVNRSMEDPQRKLRVFAEIATEARKASIERSAIPSPNFPTRGQSPTGALGSRSNPRESIGVETSPSTWGNEAALDRSEMAAEQAREGGYKSDLGTIRRDSGFAQPSPQGGRSPSAFPIGTEEGNGIGAAGDSWGQLRKGNRGGEDNDGLGEGAGRIRSRRLNERLGDMRRTGTGVSEDQGRVGMDVKEDKRTQEQKEFDALLDRERKGLGSGGDDKWA